MSAWLPTTLFLCIAACVSTCAAAAPLTVSTDECGGEASAKLIFLKTPVFIDRGTEFRAYGRIVFRHNHADAAAEHCHVIYQLYTSEKGSPFRRAYQLLQDADEGGIVGIDLVGLSRDSNQFAVNFWFAIGDGELHGPLIYNRRTHQSIYKPLADTIQKQINGCDQVEDFLGVTNRGEAIFAVPPSIYEQSPECGDKGLWYFSLATGRARLILKDSGKKWR